MEPIGRSGQRVHRVLGVRHQAEDVARLVAHPGDVAGGAVRVLARRVAVGDLALRLDLVEHVVRRPEAPFPVLDRDREPIVTVADQVDLAADEAQVLVEQQRAGQQPRLAEDLEPVADAEHRPAARGEGGDRLHRRREAGDRAGPQVVAVGEAAGDDDRVDAAQVALLVPDQPRLAEQRAGVQRVPLVAGTGELEHSPDHSSWISKSSISGLASSFSQSSAEPLGVLRLELDHAADPDVLDTLEAERRQRPLDRLALRVEDPLLRPDQNPRLH